MLPCGSVRQRRQQNGERRQPLLTVNDFRVWLTLIFDENNAP
jgi:hypothetical protein